MVCVRHAWSSSVCRKFEGDTVRYGAIAARAALPLTISPGAPTSVSCGLIILPCHAHFRYILLCRFLPAIARSVTTPGPFAIAAAKARPTSGRQSACGLKQRHAKQGLGKPDNLLLSLARFRMSPLSVTLLFPGIQLEQDHFKSEGDTAFKGILQPLHFFMYLGRFPCATFAVA